MSLFRMTPIVIAILLWNMAVVRADEGSAHDPVPGPDFAGCRLMGPDSKPYSPVPGFNISLPDGPVTVWPEGTYDFCAMMDTAYCSLGVLYSLEPLKDFRDKIAEFGGLLQCLTCDLNGPLVEGEEIPFTGNGFLDGLCELSIVAAVLNNPEHPLYEEVTEKFQANVMVSKRILSVALSQVPGYGDMRPILKSMTPYLSRALAAIIAAYGTLGDDQTYVALDALLDKLSILGMEPVPGGIQTILEGVPALSLDGDANGDGFTNRQAYHYFVGYHGHDCAEFALLAVDPDSPICLAQIEGGGLHLVGDSLMLIADYDSRFLELAEGDNSFSWSKNGKAIPDENSRVLNIPSLTVQDSGVYSVSFPARILLDGAKSDVKILTFDTEVQVDWPVPAYGGPVQLLLILSAMVVIYLISRFLIARVQSVVK
ncbi:MAG: hypothetical protein GX130_06080 [Candidatus Hydrogenedens sp.]|nr:hypothetical protein [Candidatus Hydrogenedens sp.]